MTRLGTIAWCALVSVVWDSSMVPDQSDRGSSNASEASPIAQARSRMRGFWEQECQTQEGSGPPTSSRSLFAIFDREWGIAFTQYADAACQQRMMTAVLHGTYEPTAPSKQVPGAVDMVFRFARKSLVAYDPALIERLNAGGCGVRPWEIAVEQDVTAKGCLWIDSLAACPQEYDLAKIEGERLYLGERPRPGSNICAESRRPQRLRTVALQRR
jgi:hypothetical protein